MILPDRKAPSREVQSAVQSISSKVNFQSAYFFSIQSLAALCEPTGGQFGTNAIAALHAGAVPKLAPGLTKFYKDDQISRSILRIFCSIAFQLEQDGTSDEIDKFLYDGGYDATVQWLSSIDAVSCLPAQLQLALEIIGHLEAADADIDVSVLAPSLLSKINTKLPTDIALKILSLANSVMDKEQGVNAVGKGGGTGPLLEYLAQLHLIKNFDKATLTSIQASGLALVDLLVKAGYWDQSDLGSVLILADLYKEPPFVREKLMSILARMFTEEELNRCLETLRTAPVDSPERKRALALLAPMSYISNFADRVVELGAVALLVEAVERCSHSLEVDGPKPELIKALNGACKILGNIASNPSYQSLVLDAGALSSACDTLRIVEKLPDAVAAVCAMATPLVRIQSCAEEFLSSQGLEIVLNCLSSNPDHQELQTNSARLVLEITASPDCSTYIADSDIFQVLQKVLPSAVNVSVICTFFEALTRLTAFLPSVKTIREAGLMDLITKVVRTRPHESRIIFACSQLLATLCSMDDAEIYLKDGVTAAVLLECAANAVPESDTDEMVKRGLRRIATPDDLKKIDLDQNFASVQKKSEALVQELRKLELLASCASMSKTIEESRIAPRLFEHCRKLMDGPAFATRQQILSAAMRVMANVGSGSTSSSAVAILLSSMLDFLLADAFKQDSQTLLELLPVAKNLARVAKLSLEQVEKPYTCTVSIMRKHSENRRANLECIFILTELACSSRPEGLKKCIDLKIHEFVLEYSRRVRMFEDIQIAAFAFLEMLLSSGDTSIRESIRAAGALDAANAAQTSHGKSAALKKSVVVLASKLMPAGYLEDQLNEDLRQLRRFMDSGQFDKARDVFASVHSQVSGLEGCKLANRVGLTTALVRIHAGVPKITDKTLQLWFLGQIASTTSDITITNTAARTAVKHGLGLMVRDIMLRIKDEDPAKARPIMIDCLQALRAMARVSTESECSIQLSSTLAKFMSGYPGDFGLVGGACDAYAAMPEDLVVKDGQFEAIVTSLINQLGDHDPDRVRVAAGGLAKLAASPALKGMLQKRGVTRKAYDALCQVETNSPAVLELLRLIEATSGDQSAKDTSKEETENRTRILCSIALGSNDPMTQHALLCCSRAVIDAAPNPDLIRGNMTILQALKKSRLICEDVPESQELVGYILSKVSGDDAAITSLLRISELCQTRPDKFEIPIESLCEDMNLHIQTDFKDVKLVQSVLASTMKDASNLLVAGSVNPLVCSSLIGLSATVTRQSSADWSSNDAVSVISKSVAPIVAGHMGDRTDASRLQKERHSVIQGFSLLTALMENPDTRTNALKLVETNELFSQAIKLSRLYEDDTKVIPVLYAFLAAVSSTPHGAALGEAQCQKEKIDLGGSLNECLEISPKKTLAKFGVEGVNFASASIKYSPKSKLYAANPELIPSLDAMGEFDIRERLAAIRSLALLQGVLPGNEGFEALKRQVERLRGALDVSDFAEVERRAVLREMIKTLETCGRDPVCRLALKRVGFFDAVGEVAQVCGMTSPLARKLALSLTSSALEDEDVAQKLAKTVVPIVLEVAAASKDPKCIAAALKLLDACGSHAGIAHAIAKLPAHNAFLKVAEDSELIHAPEEVKNALAKWHKIVAEDSPQVITLRKILNLWKQEMAKGQILSIEHNATVAQHINTAFEYCDIYATTAIKDLEGELADELNAGMECLVLLHGVKENTEFCADHEEDVFLLKGLRQQTNQTALQWVVEAARAATEHKMLQKNFALGNRARETVVTVLLEGLELTEAEASRDSMVSARLDLFRKSILDRNFYNNTGAFVALVRHWNAVDDDRFGGDVLRMVFRGLRGIINQFWLPEVLEHRICERVTELVSDPDIDWRVLPDAFFLVGSMSVIAQLRNKLGDLGCVEAAIDCIQREREHLNTPNRNIYPTITNALLALGSMCLDCFPNARRFQEKRGLEISVEIMDFSMRGRTEYDVANAASVVMCNVSFKRDDVKELFGNLNAPNAIMSTISKYDGSDADEAFRCLNSMFKAIGNLSLFTPNVTNFLNGGISTVLEKFLSLSAQMPDFLIETACRSLTNMAMENTEESMAQFGVLVVPLINTLNDRSNNTATELFGYGLLSLKALSRLKENSEEIVKHRGVVTAVRLSNRDSSRVVQSGAIALLGSLALHNELIDSIVDQGGLKVIVDALISESQREDISVELCTGTFRSALRVLKSQEICLQFAEQSGISASIQLLRNSVQIQLVQMEGIRLIFGILSQFPPPPPIPTKPDDDSEWEGAVPDEGFSPLITVLKRPMGPRSWEAAGFTTEQINDLITVCCSINSDEDAHKVVRMQKLALGLLAYIAAEKIKGTIETFYTSACFENFAFFLDVCKGNAELLALMVTVTANVVLVSEDDEYAVLKANDDFIRALARAERGLTKADRNTKRDVNDLATLLADPASNQLAFLYLTTWDFDLELSGWHVASYPNGVQDLPLEIKTGLRDGGSCLIITKTKLLGEPCLWKASQDLGRFQWHIGTTPPLGNYEGQLPIGRVRSIGLTGESNGLRAAMHAHPWRISKKETVCLFGPATEEEQTGKEVNLRFTDRKERDRFVAWIVEWREASS